MKKLYSKQLGSEVYALAPEQLKVFASSGYEVPTPEAVIADCLLYTSPSPRDCS